MSLYLSCSSSNMVFLNGSLPTYEQRILSLFPPHKSYTPISPFHLSLSHTHTLSHSLSLTLSPIQSPFERHLWPTKVLSPSENFLCLCFSPSLSSYSGSSSSYETDSILFLCLWSSTNVRELRLSLSSLFPYFFCQKIGQKRKNLFVSFSFSLVAQNHNKNLNESNDDEND